MTIANECPRCGKENPGQDGCTEIYESVSKSAIVWMNEDIYCECGHQIGGFSHPQNV